MYTNLQNSQPPRGINEEWSDLDPGHKDSRGFHMKGKRAAGRVGLVHT